MILIGGVPVVGLGLATVAQTLTGFIFYGPIFSKNWLEAMRKDKNNPKFLTEKPDPKDYTYKLVASVALDALKAYSTFRLLRLLRPHLPESHLTLIPLALWTAYVLPAVAGEVIWEDRPAVLPALRLGNALAAGVVGGWVAVWWGE